MYIIVPQLYIFFVPKKIGFLLTYIQQIRIQRNIKHHVQHDYKIHR